MKHSHLKRACLPFHHLGVLHRKDTNYFLFRKSKSFLLKKILLGESLLKELILKQQQVYHCHRYVGIGEVEYRTEEVAVAIYQEL